MRHLGLSVVISLLLIGVAVYAATPVSEADIARLKAKATSGVMRTAEDVALAERINATTTSHIDILNALARAKQMAAGNTSPTRPPRHVLDEYIVQPVTYDWVDISSFGNILPTGDDMSFGPYDLGFNFPFYDHHYNSVRICTNGFLSFTSSQTSYIESSIPNPLEPNTAVYAFWDDLITNISGTIYYYADAANQRFIVSWVDVPHYGMGGPNTFQVILYDSGTVVLQYADLFDATSCTIGIENQTGTSALQLCYDGTGTVPVNPSAYRITAENSLPNPVTNLHATYTAPNVTLTWTDPDHDTNGNPLIPDSILIYLGGEDPSNFAGHVAHGVQTFAHENTVPGVYTYFVRAKWGDLLSSSTTVTLTIGNPSYQQSFDIDNGQWVPSNEIWQWGPVINPNGPTAHSGANVWGTGLNDNYPANACGTLDLNLGLQVVSDNAQIEFWYWSQIEQAYDGCNFKVSTDNGNSWMIFASQDGYDGTTLSVNTCIPDEACWTGSLSPQWRHTVIPIVVLLGQTPIFRFTFGSDASVNYAGFFFDDMTIWGMGTPIPARGYLTLEQSGPPDWGYTLHQVSGVVNHLVFSNLCPGTTGSVSDEAQYHGWVAQNYPDSVVFTAMQGLTEGSLGTFWLHHPTCSDRVRWMAGDSSGYIDGPLPVELSSFDVTATTDGIRLAFATASETDNDHFEILRATDKSGTFERITSVTSAGNTAGGHRYDYVDTHVTTGQTYWYYLVSVDANGNRTEHRDLQRSAVATESLLPAEYSLSAYPNPFNPSTTLVFSLKEAGHVRLGIYDVTGRLVRSLSEGNYAAGTHRLNVDAGDLATGIYFVRLQSAHFNTSHKLLLLK
ncbi:MAG TPA: T9SS type A sorting domain-containing protein [bacterium]